MSIKIEIDGVNYNLQSNRGRVLKINTHDFKFGMEDGTVITIPRTEMRDPDFGVEDEVELYKDGREFIVRVVKQASREEIRSHSRRKVNKHLFVWVGAFLGGVFGVDRFMRGQAGLGWFKLLISPCTIYIWPIVDFLVAFYKAYGPAFGGSNEITFTVDGGYAK